MITLTPLSSSAAASSTSEPICYLLELDEARILLDMGQRDFHSSSLQSSWEYEEKVRELAPTLSLVLLSHSPSNYLSLYPYARARWNLTCPVYATQPTVEMGRVVCLAEAESWRSEHPVEDVSSSSEALRANDDDTMDGQNGSGEGTVGRREKGKQPLRGPLVPTLEEIHEAFDWIKPIRYNQPLHLGGDLSHLLLTPFPSGYVLGGTLFKIRSPTSGTILYAVGMNHTSERHIDGMVGGPGAAAGYNEGIMRPDLLIAEAGRSQVVNAKRREREGALIDLITSTLDSSRSVLIPIDPSPRLLELLTLLDQHWSFRLSPHAKRRHAQVPPEQEWPYPLCVVSRTGQDMVSFARSLIEWMGGVIRDSTSGAGGEAAVLEGATGGGGKKKRRKGAQGLGSEYGALDFRHVQFFATPTDLLQAFPLMRPKVVLAVPPSLSHGPSRFLFTTMANTEGNVLVLTSRGESGTLSRELYDRWESQQQETAKFGHGGIGRPASLTGGMDVQVSSKVPLVGTELEDFLEEERQKREKEKAHQAAVDRSRRMLEADDLDDEDDSDSDVDAAEDAADGIILTTGNKARDANAYAGDAEDSRLQMSFDIFVKGQQMRGGGGEGEMSRFRMFPFAERRGRKVDGYGEGLDIGQWVRKGREIEEEGETEEVREARRKKAEEEEKSKVPPEPPSKFVTEDIKLELRAAVFYVDMEGQHDGQAIKTIISDLQPRKLILVNATEEASTSLVNFFSTTHLAKDVFAPRTNEQVEIGEHVASYSIMLGESIAGLVSKMSKFEGYEVAMVNGKIAFSAGSTVPTLEAATVILPPAQILPKAEETGGSIEALPEVKSERLSPPPAPAPARDPESAKPKDEPLPLPGSLFVGDLRLAALKARLSALGIPAEFAGEGLLICGDGVDKGDKAEGGSVVAVRKSGEGRVEIEGGVGSGGVYWKVRREVYKSFARVAAA